MKSQFVRVVLTAGLTLLGSLTLGAQDREEIAKIPFAFQANHTSLAAGDYEVKQLNTNGTFQLVNRNEGNSIFVVAPPTQSASKAAVDGHLTFACYGGDCVLSQIWMPYSNIGYTRSQSAVDHDSQRKLGMATMINVRMIAH